MAEINKKGWYQGTTVQVYIDPAFTGQRRASIEQAFNNWTAHASANGSHVTYQFVSQPPSSGPRFSVLNQVTVTGDRAETFTERHSDGYTAYAIANLSPTMTNPAAVLEAMSHEIGHPAGFGHCNTCAPSESVMATRDRYTDDNDVIGRATSPTQCDNQRLQSNYVHVCPNAGEQPECESNGLFWNPLSCQCEPHNHGGEPPPGGGGGGDYEYDFPCTPYYWVSYESWDGGETWEIIDMEYVGCW